ncbi:GfV-B28-ORF2 [Ichnoviriform fumiferanae]|uniref:GfV-B28-ORF2 n=1 Tax=Ichnoviriform fumiferanae TaxID=419435 RepID=A2PZS8_9VIRU|nr:GfV-B28-ORF2 [Ichnoviriform fumiferanae]BAF45500.1 GfV-B28-ORF2 [Ichnoviriform fumiferanae]
MLYSIHLLKLFIIKVASLQAKKKKCFLFPPTISTRQTYIGYIWDCGRSTFEVTHLIRGSLGLPCQDDSNEPSSFMSKVPRKVPEHHVWRVWQPITIPPQLIFIH